ncbi:ATP-binding protein [Defluviimonas sp. SAOS-178_SWC]|uniref:ATP-binding protein n=1 Tax=Defluviimonas sp. SAOS-178_SWC TaxID=3121287 RepID=UPI003D80AFBF
MQVPELVPLTIGSTGVDLPLEMIPQRYERSAYTITGNRHFNEWTETFGTGRLTGAPLDRLAVHVDILKMNGESYRPTQTRAPLPAGAAGSAPSRPGTVRKSRGHPNHPCAEMRRSRSLMILSASRMIRSTRSFTVGIS